MPGTDQDMGTTKTKTGGDLVNYKFCLVETTPILAIQMKRDRNKGEVVGLPIRDDVGVITGESGANKIGEFINQIGDKFEF